MHQRSLGRAFRRRSGRPLRQQTAASRVAAFKRGGHRLGASGVVLSGSDKPPVIGLTTYLNRAQLGRLGTCAPVSFRPSTFKVSPRPAGWPCCCPPQPVDTEIANPRSRWLGRAADHRRQGRRSPLPTVNSRIRAPTNPEGRRDAWEFALLRARAQAAASGAGHLPRPPRCSNVALGGNTASATCPTSSGHSEHRAGNAIFNTLPVAHGGRHPIGRHWSANPLTARCYHHQAIAETRRGSGRQRGGMPMV